MNTPMQQGSINEQGLLTELTRLIFKSANALSPMNWLSKRCPLLKPRSPKTCERRRVNAVDMYIIAWLAIELVLILLVCVTQLPAFLLFKIIVGVVIGLRIVEIVQVTVNASIFGSPTGSLSNRVTSPVRVLVLAFVNFVELCVCFGVVYAADYTRLKGAGHAVTAFYFSIITQLTIGYGDVYPTGYLRLLAAIQ